MTRLSSDWGGLPVHTANLQESSATCSVTPNSKVCEKNQTWKRNKFHKVVHYTLYDIKKLVKSYHWDVELSQVSNLININFLLTKINTSPRINFVRVNKLMINEKMIWSFIKFSQLILTGNEWRSVWRICKWMFKERIRNFKDRLLRLQTLRLKLALPRFFTYLYFILVQILDLSFRVFCLLAEKKRLLK